MPERVGLRGRPHVLERAFWDMWRPHARCADQAIIRTAAKLIRMRPPSAPTSAADGGAKATAFTVEPKVTVRPRLPNRPYMRTVRSVPPLSAPDRPSSLPSATAFPRFRGR